ncbi:aspartate aminotransferase [Alkalihalophilus pseudofirmus OF4]|uniref:Aminotransferase n=1 Tax=Alkalihalophilus pseudofirmus (strain ATCC BAA-2126 / JCM 17055 / OF4) TaxID=398511 RepID=D3FUQ4_ALKPO|nr:LL-diaminopimelate aminotransferase [Alkalihalophilus pseudofirmus]ADC50224.1 aspartate aminotransferase [Alkalihalophilus pseudofirmus OF4]
MFSPSKKLDHLTTSVFTELSLRKQEKEAAGATLIDLSIGSPDLPPPAFLKEELIKAVSNDSDYGYAITSELTFREAVCRFYTERYGVSLNEEHVLQLMGSQDGLAHLALSFMDEDDILLVPNPGYPIYAASAEIAGATLHPYPLNEENHYQFDFRSLPQEVADKAKILILSYPSNPTAATASKDYLEQVIAYAKEHRILVVHDFAYSELLYDNQTPLSILSIDGAHEVAIEFNSMSKSFNFAGARIGYALGNPELLKPLAIIKSHIDYGVFKPIQHAATKALTNSGTFLEDQRLLYKKRRDTLVSALREIGWEVRSPGGGMFLWAKIPQAYTSMSFTLAALDLGVVVTPGMAFGSEGEGFVRIALVQNEERLKEAATRLKPLFD